MIVTLDGELWREEELETNMYDDDFYYGYMGKNSLSSSSIKVLSSRPYDYYKYVNSTGVSDSKFDFGSLFHWYVLEPDIFEKQVFLDVSRRSGKAWQEAEEKHGKVYLMSDRYKVKRLAERFLTCGKVEHILEHSEKEVPTVGMINGYCFRAKADILGDGYIVDLKTCRNLNGFKWDARDYGYAAQVYIYTELFDIDYTNWTFIAIDRNTGDFDFYTISEDFYLSGKQIVMEGISNYRLIEKGQTEFEPKYREFIL